MSPSTFDVYNMAALSSDDVNVLSSDSEGPLPLKIWPKGDNNSVEFLKQWIADNKAWLDQKLLEHGEAISSTPL